MKPDEIQRWPAGAEGRSRTSAYGGMIWTVANARDQTGGFEAQVIDSLAVLDRHLREAGSGRDRILSLQVLLTDIGRREAFDRLWLDWIGLDPRAWPQRACFQAGLAGGLLVELVAVAAKR